MDTINNGNQNLFDDLCGNEEDGDNHNTIANELYNLRCVMHNDEDVNLDEFYHQNQVLLDWTNEMNDINLITHESSPYINSTDKNFQLDDICNPLQSLVGYTDPPETVDSNEPVQNKLDIGEPTPIADIQHDLQDFYIPQSSQEQELACHSMNIIYTDTVDCTSMTTTFNHPRKDIIGVMGHSKDKTSTGNNAACTNSISHDDIPLRYNPSVSSSNQSSNLSSNQDKSFHLSKRLKKKTHMPSCPSLHRLKNTDPLLRPSRHNDLTPNPHKLIKAGQDLNNLISMMDNLAREDTINPGYQLQIRREKNKIASRICRLKKKQAYESNKIKLYGLEKEHDQITTILTSLKKELLRHRVNPTTPINATWSKTLADIEQTCNPTLKVAGRSSDYVRDIISQVVQVKSESD